MLKAVCKAAVKVYSDEGRKDANIVVKQLEIHDTEGRVRVLPDIAAEEYGDASLDQLDNSGLQVVNLGVHI